jgi:hypothetical protein
VTGSNGNQIGTQPGFGGIKHKCKKLTVKNTNQGGNSTPNGFSSPGFGGGAPKRTQGKNII